MMRAPRDHRLNPSDSSLYDIGTIHVVSYSCGNKREGHWAMQVYGEPAPRPLRSPWDTVCPHYLQRRD